MAIFNLSLNSVLDLSLDRCRLGLHVLSQGNLAKEVIVLSSVVSCLFYKWLCWR